MVKIGIDQGAAAAEVALISNVDKRVMHFLVQGVSILGMFQYGEPVTSRF